MDFGEKRPGPTQVNAAADQVSVRIAVRDRRRLGKPNTEGLASLFSTSSIQHEISRDAKNPSACITFVRWRFRKSSPNNNERLSHHVLSICRVVATLNELQ
ncbi:hypothetical protein ABIB27_000695 [Arthrobacter sp. UYEF21]